MSIYARNGKYRVEVELGRDPVTGKRKRLTGTATSRRGAIKLEQELLSRSSVSITPAANLNIEQFIDEHYLPSVEGLSATTVAGYTRAINRYIIPLVGELGITEISVADIEKMLRSIKTRGGQDNAHHTLRQILGKAVSYGLLQANPASARFTKIQKKPNDARVLRGQDEITRYADAFIGAEVEPAVLLCLGAGLRKGEAFGANWSDIDWAAGTIKIGRSYVVVPGGVEEKSPKTPMSNRVVPVLAWALDRLKVLQREGNVILIGPICMNHGTKERLHPERARQELDRVLGARDDIPHVPLLGLRHSFATMALANGVPIELVSKWLGHTSITTTYNRYVKPGTAELLEAAERLNRRVSGGA